MGVCTGVRGKCAVQCQLCHTHFDRNTYQSGVDELGCTVASPSVFLDRAATSFCPSVASSERLPASGAWLGSSVDCSRRT